VLLLPLERVTHRAVRHALPLVQAVNLRTVHST
jgi:hypothetical protein